MDAALEGSGAVAAVAASTKDRFACHIVPRAIVRSNGFQYTVTATAVFTPVPAGDRPANSGIFETWPSWVADRFASGSISVRVRPALSSGAGTELAKARSLFEVGYDALVDQGMATNRHNVLETIDKVWADWFDIDFAGLRRELSDAATKTAGTAFPEMQQPNKKVPDIISIPRAELGRRLTVARATDLFENLKNARDLTGSSLRRQRTDWMDRLRSRLHGQQPWAKPAPEGSLKKAQELAGDAKLYDPYRYEGLDSIPDNTEEQKQKKQQLLRMQQTLQAERLALDAELAKLLESRRASVQDFAAIKNACDESTSADELFNELTKLAEKACPTGPDGAAADCLDRPDQFEDDLNNDLAVQVASTLPDHGSTVPEVKGIVVARWHALQSTYSLARLAHLVVDIEFDIDSSNAAAFVDAAGSAHLGHHYLEFAISGDDVVTPRLWSLTKLNLPTEDGAVGHCWPTTVEEWATVARTNPTGGQVLDRSDTVPLDSVDGVIDLEANLIKNGRAAKRFDVLTVDMTLAAEAEIKRQQAAEAAKDLKADSETLKYEEAELAETATLKTAGLQVVDTWRQATVVRQFLTSCDNFNLDRRVDAGDLRVGFKLDVGARVGGPDGPRNWRSLTDREVTYGSTQDGTVAIDELLDAFLPQIPGHKAFRRELDGAVLNSGTRLVQNYEADETHHRAEVSGFAEPVIASWDGDPLGQRTGKFFEPGGKNVIPINQTAALPTDPAVVPFRLIFGRAYNLGMREVLLGGCAVPLADASRRYEAMSTGTSGLAYPGMPKELLRFLRHERILAPIVAVEPDLLAAEFAGERRGIDGKVMVVRSDPTPPAKSDERWRFAPDETSRVLFAPATDLSFAIKHGVQVKAEGKGQSPKGGLQDIDYDAEWGGFPVFDPAGPATVDAVRSTFFPDEEKKAGPVPGTVINGTNAPRGFAVARSRRRDARRDLEYYPDPAARYMVIALRKASDPNGYLSGNAIRVPIYPGHKPSGQAGTPGYPDARPVALRLRTYKEQAKPLVSYDDVRLRAGIKSDDDWPACKIGSGRGMDVTIYLAAGEDYEIEVWCVPEESHLLAWFDLPEGLAQLAAAPGGRVASYVGMPAADPLANWTVRRGSDTLSWVGVRQAAKALYETLLSRPLPEIASVRRLRAVHACGLPNVEPVLLPAQAPDLRVYRTTAEDAADKLQSDSTWVPTVEDASSDGGRELLVSGSCQIDPASMETIELRVVAASPKGEPFDDPRRGRSFDARARGTWPRTRRADDGSLVPIIYGDGTAQDYMGELFGFHVDPDGTATPVTSEGVLAKWRLLPDTVSPVDLLDLTRKAVEKRAGDPERYSPIERLFADTKARRLTVWPAATSRTARHIPERRQYPTDVERQVDEKRLVLHGPKTHLVLRATERPAALTAKALLPAFAWHGPEKGTYSRRTKVRIRMTRPWWTSGEEERLGVVVWPPNLTIAGTGEWTTLEQTQGRVQRVEPERSPSEIDLEVLSAKTDDAKWRSGFFTDADLGPGGKYVTRWGADPIYDAGDVSWFIPFDAFRDVRGANNERFASDQQGADLDFAPTIDAITAEGNEQTLWNYADRHKPRFVENVLMPLSDEDGQSNDPSKPKLSEKPEFMMVSLVTYEPRFDPDFEHWYVDVDLDVAQARDPFVRFGLVRFQPHAPRHLQVSAPEVKWVQVVSYNRQVTAKRIPATAAAPGSQEWVEVKIDAASNYDLRSDRTTLSADSESIPPKFRAILIEVRTLPSGQTVERVALIDLPEEECKARGVTNGPVEITSFAAVGTSNLWIERLPLPPSDLEADVSYAVLVEEFLVAQPASYSNEPVRSSEDIRSEEREIESGPRFAARIAIE